MVTDRLAGEGTPTQPLFAADRPAARPSELEDQAAVLAGLEPGADAAALEVADSLSHCPAAAKAIPPNSRRLSRLSVDMRSPFIVAYAVRWGVRCRCSRLPAGRLPRRLAARRDGLPTAGHGGRREDAGAGRGRAAAVGPATGGRVIQPPLSAFHS